MKKQFVKFVILSFLMITFLSASAQLTLRPYVGFNSSTLTKELIENSEFKSSLGYQIGADLQIGDKFYFQPGIQFEALNNTKIFLSSTGQGNIDFDLKRSYLRIPVMIGYNFTGAESIFGLRIFTGPNAAIKLNGKIGDGSGTINQIEIEDELQSMIFGWNAGIGLDVISILFVDMGYQIGLSSVFKDVEGLNEGSRNNLFYGNVGLRIKF
jgi:hypothetical protein